MNESIRRFQNFFSHRADFEQALREIIGFLLDKGPYIPPRHDGKRRKMTEIDRKMTVNDEKSDGQ